MRSHFPPGRLGAASTSPTRQLDTLKPVRPQAQSEVLIFVNRSRVQLLGPYGPALNLWRSDRKRRAFFQREVRLAKKEKKDFQILTRRDFQALAELRAE